MTSTVGRIEADEACHRALAMRAWRQGDWIELTRSVHYGPEGPVVTQSPLGCMVLSQTCDVVSPSKEYVEVAPLIATTDSTYRDALCGRTPTKIPFTHPVSQDQCLGDVTRAFPVHKSALRELAHQHVTASPTVKSISQLADRIGRVYTRFPFPDEVHECFSALQKKVRSRANNQNSPLGKMLNLVREIRVSCTDWSNPGRHLKFHLVVKRTYAANPDDIDETWEPTPDRVRGLHEGEELNALDFYRLCDLLHDNRNSPDETTKGKLWDALVEKFVPGVWGANGLTSEIASIEVEWESDEEFSVAEMSRSYSLDLEVLSHSGV